VGPPRGELSRETERADKGVAHSPLLRSHTHATQRGQRMINLENRSHMRHGVCARFSTVSVAVPNCHSPFSMYVALTYIPGGGLLTGFAMRSDPKGFSGLVHH